MLLLYIFIQFVVFIVVYCENNSKYCELHFFIGGILNNAIFTISFEDILDIFVNYILNWILLFSFTFTFILVFEILFSNLISIFEKSEKIIYFIKNHRKTIKECH